MFSYDGAAPSLPNKHRRGGPVHVHFILRDLEVDIVETFLTGQQSREPEPGAGRPATFSPYPQAA